MGTCEHGLCVSQQHDVITHVATIPSAEHVMAAAVGPMGFPLWIPMVSNRKAFSPVIKCQWCDIWF